MTGVQTCALPIWNNLADFKNLRPDTTYYWRGIKANGKAGKTFSFTTVDTVPHWISIPGISNVRDLANWKSARFGKRVKRGMVYRGTEFDDRIKIKPEGRPVFLGLKIKTDLDLRGFSPDKKKDFVRAFPEIRRVAVPMKAYNGTVVKSPKEKFAKLLVQMFNEFSKAENYPFLAEKKSRACSKKITFFIG